MTMARMAWRCLPIDARRPASWLGVVCTALGAAAAGGAVAGVTPPRAALAIVAGAAAALAAIGDPPGATMRPRPDPRLLMAATLSRSVWPLGGAAAAALVGAPGAFAAALGGAVVAAAATILILRRAGADAAEAAGATLFAAATAAAAAGAMPATTRAPGLALPAAVTAWVAVVVAAVAWTRGGVRPTEWTGTEAIEAIGWPAASGRLGAGLVAVSMIAALFGMAGWLFLAPDRSGWYGTLALACFVALAVPRATLAWGAIGAGRRRLVLKTAAGAPPGGHGLARRIDCLVGAGFLGPEWRVPASAAAILGWPPLVAAGVVGGTEAADRVGLVAALFAWGAGLAVGTALVLRAGASRETALAVALLVALAASGLAAGQETPQNHRIGGRTGVEESRASCETPQPRWPPTVAARARSEPRQAVSFTV